MASAAPIQTGSGRYRLAITMVAIMVLSGSSATKMSPKVMARTDKLIDGSSWSALLQALQPGVQDRSGGVSQRRRQRDVDLESLEGLLDGALAYGQGMGAHEGRHGAGQIVVAAQRGHPAEHPGEDVGRDPGHELVPMLHHARP